MPPHSDRTALVKDEANEAGAGEIDANEEEMKSDSTEALLTIVNRGGDVTAVAEHITAQGPCGLDEFDFTR